MHNVGILHHDVKVENIILSKKYKVSDIKFYCIPLDKVESISDILDDNIDNYEIYGGITLEVRDK
jgi:tRNA A-37 threonylcarbamoyl transferase component Bud32